MSTMNTLDTQSSSSDRWIPILDYAVLCGISTSTLRRYIKAKKIQFKVENGRYLLLADPQTATVYAEKQKQTQKPALQTWPNAQKSTLAAHKDYIRELDVKSSSSSSISVFQRVRELEEKLVQAEEQISELKMLVAIYEEKLSQKGH